MHTSTGNKCVIVDEYHAIHVSSRTETVQVLWNYTYADHSDVFEREPLLVHIRDLTSRRMYLNIVVH